MTTNLRRRDNTYMYIFFCYSSSGPQVQLKQFLVFLTVETKASKLSYQKQKPANQIMVILMFKIIYKFIYTSKEENGGDEGLTIRD